MSDLYSNEATQQPPADPLTDHEYDGIREYDNPIPGWWSWLFIGSIVFAVVYYAAYHLGTAGTSVAQAYVNQVNANLQLQFAEIGTLNADEATILEYMHKPDWVAFGKQTFAGNCVSCHGKEGEGLVGPNMTDDYYKNVKTLGDIGTVIQKGAANGAMPAWANRLHPNEIVMVSAYIASLRGKNLPGPRPAEGVEIAPWPDAPADAGSAPGESSGAVENPQ
ncbi:MAG: cbb3-type cytochrome c oxidase N-terminal domain-containing protein [Phycisphaerales bacterium]